MGKPLAEMEIQRRIEILKKHMDKPMYFISYRYGVNRQALMLICKKYGINHPDYIAKVQRYKSDKKPSNIPRLITEQVEQSKARPALNLKEKQVHDRIKKAMPYITSLDWKPKNETELT